MKCSEARAFLFQISDREQPVSSIPTADLNYLCSASCITRTSKDEYDKQVGDVSVLTQMTTEMDADRGAEQEADATLQQDMNKEHPITFHFERDDEKNDQ